MDWTKQMENELNKTGLSIKVSKVPKRRCASSKSIPANNSL